MPNPKNADKDTLALTALYQKASALGFVSMGVSRPTKPPFFDHFTKWVHSGRNAEMHWIETHMDLRENPKKLLPGCLTIVSLAYPYTFQKPLTPDGYSTARYVEPEKPDYHQRMKQLGKDLAKTLRAWYPDSKSRVCVDSAPLLERSFAYAAGMGFIGHNNALIIPDTGSYVYLMEILTTAPLSIPDIIPMKNQCGNCNQCIKACPTGALDGPFSFDATQCLSYLTIEHPADINAETGKSMGNCFFGCDICQEVCPFNKQNETGKVMLPSTLEILQMEPNVFKDQLGTTALSRAGLNKIKRNILAIKA